MATRRQTKAFFFSTQETGIFGTKYKLIARAGRERVGYIIYLASYHDERTLSFVVCGNCFK